MSNKMNEAIERIRRMEEIFDELASGVREEPPRISEDLLGILIDYYDNGEWMQDFELDEAGFLPRELKRGVLSEDAVYDLLSEISEIILSE